jgi:hypothetical protein
MIPLAALIERHPVRLIVGLMTFFAAAYTASLIAAVPFELVGWWFR